MASKGSDSNREQPPPLSIEIKATQDQFFVWREFVWGGIAGAFGEGMMHPVDTLKTRLQSQIIMNASQRQKSIPQMLRTVWVGDGLKGFYRGIAPGVTGSLATGATYFGVIESTKKWIEESHPNLGGHWVHFIAGAIGDTLGSFVYVPCEVIKQRMQIQGTSSSWSSFISRNSVPVKPRGDMYGYYTGMFQAGSSILKEQGPKGLYAGYWSTLARDVPFAGLMVMFYEAELLKDLTDQGKKKFPQFGVNSSIEGLVLGGLAGGLSAYLTTPLDVVKTRLQVQGTTIKYKGWLDAVGQIWRKEGPEGFFRGSVPRVMWYIPASALTFMAVEFLRESFREKTKNNNIVVSNLSIESKRSSVHEVREN
ncbi:LOW QUALITY PROTEIN: mitochondrial substrate carrier family protein E [Brassica napus]|uniref:LOW QUALITY PROTEIN: mitochondrial substrate carrier family protein E n=1 Tax=Brassica napus TaxID=3708 RepID=UPI002078CF4F|nr:LOW QUALITY PROTEIN: mitochondrial substrate carrier family protein E [Brassica napus]